MNVVKVPNGFVVHGAFPDADVVAFIKKTCGKLPLVIADPPYGNILSAEWDKAGTDDSVFCDWMISWTQVLADLSLPGAALYTWGGVGRPMFRPFYLYLINAERLTPYSLANHITWSKKRAYGVQTNYLFTREELAYFVLHEDYRKPRCFNIPLLEIKRGYAGYDDKYPAKSEFLRRTNVWHDVTEIFRGKIHEAQKPVKLHEIMIQTHTKKGEWVLDPFAGSGTTGAAAQLNDRKFVVVEKDVVEFEKCVNRLNNAA